MIVKRAAYSLFRADNPVKQKDMAMFKAISTVSAVVFLALSACAPTTTSTSPVTSDEPIRSADGTGQCRIEDWKSWEGKSRQSLPSAPQGLVFRVLCDTCAATMDYRQNRVTFTYNEATQNITRVSCG